MVPNLHRHGDKSRRKTLGRGILLLVFVTVGLIARLWHADSTALWTDEAISARAAQGILLRGVPSVKRLGEGFFLYERGRLHSYLVSASFELFGVSTLSARLPGILFGVMLIPVVYLLGKYTVNTRVGIYAASLVTLHPWTIATSRYTRFYAEFQTLFVLALVAYLGWLRSVDSNQRHHSTPLSDSPAERQSDNSPYPYLFLLAVTLIAAYYTHRFYLLIVGILASYTATHVILTRRIRSLLNPRPLLVLVLLPAILFFGISYRIFPTQLSQLTTLSNYSNVDAGWIIDYFLVHQPILIYLSILGIVILTARSVFSTSERRADFLIFCFATTFLGLSFGIPIIVGEPQPRYFSPIIPIVIITAATSIDEAVQFAFRHPDLRSIRAVFPSSILDGRGVVTTVVVLLILFGTFPTATPHFESNGYQAEFTYGSPVQRHDLKGPSEHVLNHSSGNVTVYVRPMNTPTFYLDWERGGVDNIRYLNTSVDGDVSRWADDEYVIEDLDELKQRVRDDADRGEVWFLVKNWWKQPERAEWVRAYSTRVNRSWKDAKLYKYRGDELFVLEPNNAGWEEAVVSVDGNVFGTPNFLALGRRTPSNVTWRSSSDENRGELILSLENQWESVKLTSRIYGNEQDRFVTIYYSTDGENWTKAIDHDDGGWTTFSVRLNEIKADDDTIYLRIVGGSSSTEYGGGVVDFLRLESVDHDNPNA